MSVPVVVTVLDDLTSPVEGATVEVYDAAGALFDTQVTDVLGQANFTLVGGTGQGARWHTRVYKVTQGLFSPLTPFFDRKTLLVLEPPVLSQPNEFTITVPSIVLQGADDPGLCRVHAQVGFQDTYPRRGYPIYVRTRRIPTIYYTEPRRIFLSGDRIDLRTQKDGKAFVDLVRDGIYTLYVPDLMDEEVIFVVPDAPSADLWDLVFPYVRSLTISPNPLSLLVDEVQEVEVQNLVFSDGRLVDCENNLRDPKDFIQTEILSGSNVVDVQLGALGRVTVRAKEVGTASLGFSRIDQPQPVSSYIILPKPPITLIPLTITVT